MLLENGADAFTQYRGATNLQIIKNKTENKINK
jgi:hypothetical protein